MDPRPVNSCIKVTTDDAGVALIELCRAEKRNALSQVLINELVAAISQVEKDDRVRAVVLTGSPTCPFSGT